ncbi:DUF5711 family protein [uncultured Ruminococcus sp.]|uniref:DUF5711 family protein n=1 Tax=uncultured Ruminococcus sp. TaxID=165186 RepID=UPI00292FAE37|nr:DUF5711 family protein [uncultured Ruminococcus sp.]
MERQGRRFADDIEATKVIEKLQKQPKQKEKPNNIKNNPKPEKEKKPKKEKTPSEKELLRERKKREKQLEKDRRLKEKNAKRLEKLMKKQRKNNHNAVHTDDRDPDSLRDNASASDESSAPKNSFVKIHKRRIIAAAVIVLLLFAVVFVISNPARFSLQSITNFFNYGVLNRNSDERFPLDISGESVSPGDFYGKGINICYSSDTKTQELNNYGRVVFTSPHSFINPVLVSGKKQTLVYNLGGTGYQVIDAEHNVRTLEAKDNIMVADITDSGVYALVTQNGGYLSKLYVFNEDDDQIFAYSFADYYVTSVTLSNTGRQAVVSGLSASEGMDIAALYVLDFTKDTPLYLEQIENNIIYDVCYMNDHSVAAVGRSAAYVINTGNGNMETIDYEGKSMTAYDINTDTDTFTISLSGSGDGRNCDIVTFNSSGRADKSFHIDEKITDLSTYKGRVALLTGDSVLLYSKDGKQISEKELRSDPHTVVLYTGSDAYVLCTGYIDSIRL